LCRHSLGNKKYELALNITNLEKEYARIITALNRSGILTLLPRLENLRVVGIDGADDFRHRHQG